jgi:hypothetical protein
MGRLLAQRSANRAANEAAISSQQLTQKPISTEELGPRRIERDFNKPDLRPHAQQQRAPIAPPEVISHDTYVRNRSVQKKDPTPVVSPNDVTLVPDSWQIKHTIKETERSDDEPRPRAKSGPKKLPANKVRRQSLSIAVSPEEAEAFHKHAGRKGMTFSEWARGTLMRSMNQPIPK